MKITTNKTFVYSSPGDRGRKPGSDTSEDVETLNTQKSAYLMDE